MSKHAIVRLCVRLDEDATNPETREVQWCVIWDGMYFPFGADEAGQERAQFAAKELECSGNYGFEEGGGRWQIIGGADHY